MQDNRHEFKRQERKSTPHQLLTDWQDNLTDLYHEADTVRDGNDESGEGRYIDETPLSSGGEKRIFTVFDQVTQREIALARPLNKNNHSFLREARLTASLTHPSIITIYDVHEEPDDICFTMKLVRGKKLGVLREQGFDRQRQLEIFMKVCDGVAYAHDQGIVHLDLKPSNVMVGQFGEAVILDWGLARRMDELSQLSEGVTGGTPGYMAPEQKRRSRAGTDTGTDTETEAGKASSDNKQDHAIGPKSDVYALGAILFFILHGKLPDEMGSVTGSRLLAATDVSDPLSNLSQSLLKESLSRVAIKAMRHDPADRYESALALKSDVQRYLDGYATEAENASYLKNLSYLYQRNRKLIQMGMAACLLLVAMTAFYVNRIEQREARAIDAEKKAGEERELAMIARRDADFASQAAAQASREAVLATREADEAKRQADRSRKQAEISQKQAEVSRLQAEEARLAAERSQILADDAKAKADESQRRAEQSQKQAELSKSQSEESQKLAELSKVQAEKSKAEAEAAKQQAELALKQADQARRLAASEQLKAASARQMAAAERKKADEARTQALKVERKAAAANRNLRDLSQGIKFLLKEYRETDGELNDELLKGVIQLGTKSNKPSNVYYEKVQLILHLRRNPEDGKSWRDLGMRHLIGYDFKLAEDCFFKAEELNTQCYGLLDVIKPLADRDVTMATLDRKDLLPLFQFDPATPLWPWLLNRILTNELEKRMPDDALYDLMEAYLQISKPNLKMNYRKLKRGYKVSFNEMPGYLAFRFFAFSPMGITHLEIGSTNYPIEKAVLGMKAKAVDLTKSNIKDVTLLARNKTVKKVYLKPENIEVGLAELLRTKEVLDAAGQPVVLENVRE